MTRDELISKATYKRMLPIRVTSSIFGVKQIYGDIEYYFDHCDVEIGHYCKVTGRVFIFENGREWSDSIKMAHKLLPLNG